MTKTAKPKFAYFIDTGRADEIGVVKIPILVWGAKKVRLAQSARATGHRVRIEPGRCPLTPEDAIWRWESRVRDGLTTAIKNGERAARRLKGLDAVVDRLKKAPIRRS